MEKNTAADEAKVEIPPPVITSQEKSGMERLVIPADRERNIGERKNGYEYSIVVINFKPGLKFGLGIKNVYKSIFVIKADENSLVTGLFNVADRIIDVDGELVNDNQKCKGLLVKALKEKKIVSLLIERGITEKALKDATDEMNEEHNQSVMAPPDVRSIMRKMEAHRHLRKSPSQEAVLVPVVPAND
uniref:PDZ domain-containing protein n=1 Tax=Caenorhabditis tropicalis TaxID=1561998 RepID=A0A1I7U850_9PELO